MYKLKTSVIKIDHLTAQHEEIKKAASLLKVNEVVAFPTETVYGLGANAKSEEAVRKIFKAKGRPSDNPLIIHIANQNQLEELVTSIPEQAKMLMEVFWPGPLTFIFPKSNGLSETATAGLDTVAIRMPDHPVALALIEAANLPIAAPSANLSGKPSPTSAEHVYKDMVGRIRCIIDGGETGVGVESTVLDCTADIPMILRPGGITKEQIEAVIGEVRIDPALHNDEAAPKSPGMKYTHYAPNAPFVLVDGSSLVLQGLVDKKRKEGYKVGVLTTNEMKNAYSADVIISCGNREDLASVAAGLYEALRKFDDKEVDFIYSEVFSREGIGEAIMNRLTKAAGNTILKENDN